MALTEPWTAVLAQRTENARCAHDVAAIKQTCATDHHKAHTLECPECWPKLVSRLRDLYLKPLTAPEAQWFVDRGDFLLELDGLFSRTRNPEGGSKPDFRPVDKRIQKEKETWFRETAAKMGLQAATQSSTEAKSLHNILQNNNLPVTELIAELRNAFQLDDEDLSTTTEKRKAFDDFLEKLEAVPTPKEKADVYVQAIFQPQKDAATAAKAEKYINLLRNGTSSGEVLSILLRDRRSSQGEQDERRKLQDQLAELRRAKAAHQLSLSRRDKVRQDKARAVAEAKAKKEEEERVAAEGYGLPKCVHCEKDVDVQGFDICPLCQVMSDYGVEVVEPVVWCEEKCREEGIVSFVRHAQFSKTDTHISEYHDCASNEDCINTADEDVDMDGDKTQTLIFCRECLVDIKSHAAVFCSPRCYAHNFQKHREQVHLPERRKAGREVNDRSQLEFEPASEDKYRALKIEENFITMDAAMKEYAEKTGATLS